MILTLDNGTKLTVPMTAEDIKFSEFVDGTTLEQELLKEEQFGYESLPEILTCYFPESVVASLDYDDITPLEAQMLVPGSELTTATLYNHIVAVVNSYELKTVKEFAITHKGEKFFIASLEELVPTRKLTVGESLTMLELSKRVTKLKEKKGDPNGNYEFSLGLEEIAILARKKGERLPITQKERQEFISKRAEFFKDCPLSEVLKVRFFFIHFFRKSLKIRETKLFGNVLSSQRHPPKRKEKRKRKR